MKMTFKTKQDVFNAVAEGKLAGYEADMPEGWSIANEKFPVTLEVDKKAKTYKVYVEPKPEVEAPEAPKVEAKVETKKGFNWKKFWIIFGSTIAGLVVAAGIVCGILFTENSGDSSDAADNNATVKLEAPVK